MAWTVNRTGHRMAEATDWSVGFANSSKGLNPLAQQKEQTRDRILGAAENIFADKGYHEALVDEIAEETALSKGGVYFHFPSKKDLFFAVLDRLAGRLVVKVEKSAAGEESPIASAEAALVAVLSALGRKRRLARLLVVQGYSMGNPFEQKRVEIFGRFAGLIKGCVDSINRVVV